MTVVHRRCIRAVVPFTAALFALMGSACDDRTSVEGLRAPARAGEMCDSVPAPRWVVRDKDGNRVQALVEPRCGHGQNGESWSRCHPVDPASLNNFPCVRIIDFEGKFINLQYDLMTGQIGPCQENQDLNQDWATLGVSYINDKCEGDRYVLGGWPGFGSPEFTKTRTLYYANGEMWYPSEAGCLDDAPTWGISSNKCVGPFPSPRQCPLLPVPQWVKNLLPNPPYTMEVEYE